MTLEELYLAIAADFKIDKTELGNEALRTSDLFVKYIKIYSNEKLILEALENKKKVLLSEKRDYYSGNAAPEVYKDKPFDLKIRTETGMQKYLDNDIDVVKFEEKMLIQKQKVEVLYNCLDEIKRRGYAVKSAIEWTRFMNGA